MYGSNCKGAEDEGVSILHGNRGVYHDNKQPAFKVVYDAIRDVSVSLLTSRLCTSSEISSGGQKKRNCPSNVDILGSLAAEIQTVSPDLKRGG